MQPNRIGRILGIGARVAGEKLSDGIDRLGATPAAPPAAAAPAPPGPRPAPRPAPRIDPALARQAAGHTRRLARGAGRFGSALARPFAHATRILWYQIAGLFFALFALFFLEHSWQIYKSSRFRDHHLPIYVALALLFAWFTVSSFWRARSRQRGR